MKQDKRRPTLDELKDMPTGLLKIEIAQLCFDAGLSENYDIQSQAEMLSMEPDPQPERIVELWNQLHRASGSNSTGAQPFIERLEPERPE